MENLKINFYLVLNFKKYFWATMLLFTFIWENGIGQVECSTPDPTISEYQAMRSQIPDFLSYLDAEKKESTIEIPLHFTVGRTDGGIVPGDFSIISQGMIDDAVDYLNLKITGAGGNLHFYRLGDVRYIDYNNITYTDPSLANFGAAFIYSHFNYLPTAINIHIQPYGTGFGAQPGSDLNNAPTYHNIVTGIPKYFADVTKTFNFVHEMGHVFSLLHTFGVYNPYMYPEVLTDPNILDHPYTDVGFRRELAIRNDLPSSSSKPFKTINCWTAGDLLCDTDADCAPNNPGRRAFPAFTPTNIENCKNNPNQSLCIPGCATPDCTPHSGQYRDYNEDPVVGATNNIMSYHFFSCEPVFTPQQVAKMEFTFQDYWQSRLTQDAINLIDRVEYKGTTEKVKNVTINWQHPNTTRFSNTTSDYAGRIQGILYFPNVKAKVKKRGSARDVAFYYPNNGPAQFFSIDKYNYEDWLEKLSTWDAFRIGQHVLSINLITSGYDKIAADVNNSGTITNADGKLIQRLVAGIIPNFNPYHTEPWLFVPEYIPQDYTLGFNTNPYNININGQTIAGLAYTKDTWEYEINDGIGGKAGYDAIKIGDVAASGITNVIPCNDTAVIIDLPMTIIEPGNEFELSFKVSNFTAISAFQLGVVSKDSAMQIIETTGTSLLNILPEENVGSFSLPGNEQNTTMAWFNENGVTSSLPSNTELIKIKAKANKLITNLEDAISINHPKVETAFFDLNGCKSLVNISAEVTLTSQSEERNSSKSIPDNISNLICYPNPATNDINIYFQSEKSDNGVISLVDFFGKKIYETSITFNKGINNFTIDSQLFGNLEGKFIILSLHTTASNESIKIFLK
jgi:hypothetical protein